MDGKSEDERVVLEGLGIVHEPAPQSFLDRRRGSPTFVASPVAKGLHVPAGIDEGPRKMEKKQLERIAIFASGISAKDIPVPRSMKGS